MWTAGALVALGASLVAGPEAPTDAAPSAAPAAEPGATFVVDQLVARVDKAVITQSALTAEARLLLLDSGTPQRAIDAPLTQALLSAVLRSMVDRTLLLNEMRRLQLRPASEEELSADVARLARRFEAPEQFRAFLVDIGLVDPGAEDVVPYGAPAGLVDRLRVEREVQRFVDVRIRPSLVTSEREVRACFEARRKRFAGVSLEQASPVIRARLREQKEARALRSLLEQLRLRAKVRIAKGFQTSPPAEPAPLGWSCPERTR